MTEASGRRLGRGLSALLGDYGDADAAQAAGPVDRAPIETLHANPNQPRKSFDEDALAALTASIESHGVLQPLLVRRREDGEFEIIAGERRWRAAQRAQLHDVPIRVVAFNDQATLEAAIIENVQRADLNPLEEAAGYQALVDAFDHTQESLAKVVGKSRSHVANMLRLLSLPSKAQSLVRDGSLSMGHARALLGAADPDAAAERAVREGWSVRETERQVQRGVEAEVGAAVAKRAKGMATPARDPDTAALEADLAATLGLEVAIKQKDGRGVLSVTFSEYEQLDDICRRLTRRKD